MDVALPDVYGLELVWLRGPSLHDFAGTLLFMLKREDSLYQGVVWLRKHGSVLHQLGVSDSEEGAYAPMTHSCAGCITFRNAQDRHAVERDQILWKCIGTLK